ncbi:MAG: DUF547 domain-containing protein [Candidatus Hinthialibacter antarcticus]|nr:DUF547 domain-containing protein [Candidatus Hinthialibacter antarcticus]
MLRSRKRKICVIVVVALSVLGPLYAMEESVSTFDYVDYQSVLARSVSDQGLVDYAGLKQDAGTLNSFLDAVASLDASQYEKWAEPDRIAFLINVYNACTLKALIDHYPIQSSLFGRLRFPANSIRQISGVWDKLQWNLMGKMETLDGIEHGMLRKHFNEPRIHFAVNCASMGCPVLLNEPYLGERLDEQLDAQVRRFVARPFDFQYDSNTGVVKLSMILKWYAGDFVQYEEPREELKLLNPEQRGVINFLWPYLNEPQQASMKAKPISVSFLEYDWSLNEQ